METGDLLWAFTAEELFREEVITEEPLYLGQTDDE